MAGTEGSALDLVGVSASATLPGTQQTHIVSGLLNYNPRRGEVLSARYAAKVADVDELVAKLKAMGVAA